MNPRKSSLTEPPTEPLEPHPGLARISPDVALARSSRAEAIADTASAVTELLAPLSPSAKWRVLACVQVSNGQDADALYSLDRAHDEQSRGPRCARCNRPWREGNGCQRW